MYCIECQGPKSYFGGFRHSAECSLNHYDWEGVR